MFSADLPHQTVEFRDAQSEALGLYPPPQGVVALFQGRQINQGCGKEVIRADVLDTLNQFY